MRAYVTGASGFVGTWLCRHLRESGDEVEAPDLSLDVRDGDAVTAAIGGARPDVVYHLAGFAQVGESWSRPAEVFAVNALGTLNTLEAVRRCEKPPRVLVVSSAEVYGAVANDRPIDESGALAPVSPYAASKVAAEYLGVQAFLGSQLDVVRLRPFNHVGPGQSDSFVVSALARRVVAAERNGGGTVAVGNLDPVRDFTDVRDVVRAYRLLAAQGRPGEVYNVATGRGVSVREVTALLARLAYVDVSFEADPKLTRPVDVPVLLGDASKLRRATGWEPRHELEGTLTDVLEYWRQAADETM